MAVGVRVKVNLPEIDLAKSEREIHKVMTRFTLDTLKTWVLATVDPIPVLTGASRASFLRLAAEAGTSITINPKTESRIFLGITEAESEIFAMPGQTYGWSWSSTLDYIGVVEDRVGFIDAGLNSIKNAKVELPQPVLK